MPHIAIRIIRHVQKNLRILDVQGPRASHLRRHCSSELSRLGGLLASKVPGSQEEVPGFSSLERIAQLPALTDRLSIVRVATEEATSSKRSLPQIQPLVQWKQAAVMSLALGLRPGNGPGKRTLLAEEARVPCAPAAKGQTAELK